MVHRSLSAIPNDTTLDDKNGTSLDGRHLCALKRKQEGAVKRVAFNDAIDYGTTMAYSTIYGTSPKLVVATANGTMKSVSAMADHYTKKAPK